MELIKVNGNSYYINAPTNTGVYVFKNKNCLLVDTGIGISQAKKVEEVLNTDNLHPKYIINTHSHEDHCGGNKYFQNNYPGCIVYASEGERVYMENPYLLSSMLFSSNPIRELYKKHKPSKVDYSIEPGQNKINDEKFEIISLKGHSVDQIGLITSDLVCYLGDSIFSEEILNKYSFPFLFNIDESIATLNYLRDVPADYFVISHSDRLLDKHELIKLIELNLKNIEKYSAQILDLLEQALTREEILESLIILNDLPLNFTQYYLYLSSVSAFIAYLYEKDLISYSIENGKIYYYQ